LRIDAGKRGTGLLSPVLTRRMADLFDNSFNTYAIIISTVLRDEAIPHEMSLLIFCIVDFWSNKEKHFSNIDSFRHPFYLSSSNLILYKENMINIRKGDNI